MSSFHCFRYIKNNKHTKSHRCVCFRIQSVHMDEFVLTKKKSDLKINPSNKRHFHFMALHGFVPIKIFYPKIGNVFTKCSTIRKEKKIYLFQVFVNPFRECFLLNCIAFVCDELLVDQSRDTAATAATAVTATRIVKMNKQKEEGKPSVKMM